MFASGHELEDEDRAGDRDVARHLERAARGFGADIAAGCADARRRRPAAERGDAVGRLGQALLRETAGADGVDDRGVHPLDRLLVQVVAEPERVRAGDQRADGCFLDAVGRADGGHLERVGDDQAVEAELAAQQPGQDRLAEASPARRPGRARPDGRASPPDACGDRGAERQQRRVEVALDHRELAVRVGGGVAVAGEVLRAGRHALALRAGDERSDVTRDELGIGAEAAHADDGVQRDWCWRPRPGRGSD